MLRRIVISSLVTSIATSVSFASGCSSGSAGTGSSSGGTSEAGGDTRSGSSSGASGSSGGGDATSSSGGSGVGDAGGSCTMPASTVPSSDITTYMTVVQVKGACTSAEIASYYAACLGPSDSQQACAAWFANDAGSLGCQNCLIGPLTTQGDAQAPTGQGGVWFWNDINLGANLPGCLALEGETGCAQAYTPADECFVLAGCSSCATQSATSTCQQTIFGTGGACAAYSGPYMTSCAAADGEGGVHTAGGACADDISILSVICGNGSGDGG